MQNPFNLAGAVRGAISRLMVQVNGAASADGSMRTALTAYAKVFTGDFGRLLIQVGYFLVLANTLTLSSMGVFAAVLATGLILANFSGLGFGPLAFKLVSAKPRLAGAYMAASYAMLLATLPIVLAVSVPIYLIVFSDRLSYASFLEILICEVLLWRAIEIVIAVNYAKGRYGQAAAAQIVGVLSRAIAVVLFALSGANTVEIWARYYLVFNIVGCALVLLLLQPPARLRLNLALIRGRLRDAMLLGFRNFLMSFQNEIDKVAVLALIDARTAGIYAISIRVLELIAVPIRTFYTLYTRKLVTGGKRAFDAARNLLLEAGVFIIATTGFLILMGMLAVFPNLLGSNVAAAYLLYGTLIFLPAFRCLAELHLVLYFAYGHMATRAAMVGLLGSFRTLLFVTILMLVPNVHDWGLWFNLMFAGLYVLSAVVAYAVLTFGSLPRALGRFGLRPAWASRAADHSADNAASTS